MEARQAQDLHPINILEDRICHINERMSDAQDIFCRKFNLVQDQVSSMLEKIEEDKQFQQEAMILR